MGKRKKVDEKRFNRLSEKNQIKELVSLTKRANVRIKLLEDTGESTSALREVKNFFKNVGAKADRFYQGVKYNTTSEIRQTFDAVRDFLNNDSSVLTGIRKDVHKKIDRMVESGSIDTQNILTWSKKEQIYASQRMATLANRRMKELEEHGITQYAYAKADLYLQETGRNNHRFYRGSKFTDGELRTDIEEKAHFLESKTSTKQGYDDSIVKRINTFRNRGIIIDSGFEKDFLQFLASSEFKAMAKYNASDQLIETLDIARNAGVEVDIINREFKKFIDGKVNTLDRVKENLQIITDKRYLRRGEGDGSHTIAPWLKKQWLK